MSGKKRFFLAVLLVIIAGGIYVYKEFNRTNANIEKEKPAFTSSATELIKAFNENDSLASSKYVGKVISVTGLVKNINKDERGYYTLNLGDTLSMSSVRCSVDSIYTNQATSVKPGTTIKVKGMCTGYNSDELLGLDIIINRCVIDVN